jgi:hypothetical protein
MRRRIYSRSTPRVREYNYLFIYPYCIVGLFKGNSTIHWVLFSLVGACKVSILLLPTSLAMAMGGGGQARMRWE